MRTVHAEQVRVPVSGVLGGVLLMSAGNAAGRGDNLSGGSEESGQAVEVCTECNRKFRRKWNLKAHSRVHTGAHPYKCDEPGCKKTFKWSSSLQYHKRTHNEKKRPTDQQPAARKRKPASSPATQPADAKGSTTPRRDNDREDGGADDPELGSGNPMSINFLTS